MAPVTATSAGIARQIIDDPALISLLVRLSSFYKSKIDESSSAKKAESTPAVFATNEVVAYVEKGDEDVKNIVDGSVESPPFDIDGFVAELDKCPSWRFQEQVSDAYFSFRTYCSCVQHPSSLIIILPVFHFVFFLKGRSL